MACRLSGEQGVQLEDVRGQNHPYPALPMQPTCESNYSAESH